MPKRPKYNAQMGKRELDEIIEETFEQISYETINNIMVMPYKSLTGKDIEREEYVKDLGSS